MTITPTTPATPESVAARLRDLSETLYYEASINLCDDAARLIVTQAAEIARLTEHHKVDLIEIGDAAGADLRHHNDALLHYSAVASVKRLRDVRNGLLDDIDEAWEAFGTAGNRGVLTLAEQIGSLDRELDDAKARAALTTAADSNTKTEEVQP